MDSDDKLKDSSPVARKVPLEELSKEDLVKRCKSVILLAQKAKQAKDEASEEIAKKNILLLALEEKCQTLDNEYKKEVYHTKKLQEQLQATQELLASQQNLQSETEAMVEQRVAALTASIKAENAELLKELNVMNQVLKQRGELISKMTASHADYSRKIDELEISLANTTKELHLKTTELESMSDFTRQVTELKSTLSAMTNDIHQKDKKIEALTLSQKESESIKEELRLKVDLIDKLQVANKEEKSQLQKIIDAKEDCISQMQREIEMCQVQLKEISSNNEELETLKFELASRTSELENCIDLQGKIKDLQEKLTNVTIEKDEELVHLQEEITHLKQQLNGSCQDLKEDFQREAAMLHTQLESYKQQCCSLMEDLESRNAILEHLESLKVLINEKEAELVDVKEKLYKETEEKSCLNQAIIELETQLASLKESLSHEKSTSLNLEKSCLEKEQIILQLQSARDKELTQAETLQINLDTLNGLEAKVLSLTNSLEMKEKTLLALQENLEQKSESLATCQMQLEDSKVYNEATLSDLKCLLEEAEKKKEEKDIKIINLEKRIEFLDPQVADLHNQVDEKSACITSYENELFTLKTELNCLNESVSKVSTDLEEKEEMIRSKDAYISTLSDENKLLKEQMLSLQCTLTEMKTTSSNSSQQNEDSVLELSAKIEELQLELNEKRCELKNLKAEKEQVIEEHLNALALVKELEYQLNTIQANYESSTTAEGELRQQLISLQEMLQTKETHLLNLEQELSKVKEGFASVCHETSNTEVSSTYSMSQSEEQARLRDLEDSFEDKYTKLRVVAVKLKRKVSELTQTLESERMKMTAEKSELQARLAQLANHAKTTQTLQSEIDRLQDKLEEQKRCHQQLAKDLDASVQDAASAKSQLTLIQEQLHEVTQERNSLQVSKAKLETALSHAEALSSETDRLCKEIREKEMQLDQCIEEKRKLSEQLEKACADAKKKSVLSLEMEDMERSVFELTQQLNSEKALSKSISSELDQERELSSSLREQLKRVDEIVKEKEQAIVSLEEKLSSAQSEVEEFRKKYQAQEELTKQLQVQVEAQQSKIEGLNLQCSDLASKQVQISENARQQIEALSRQVFQLEEQCSALKDANNVTEAELAALNAEFAGYKVRAQSILRQSTRQEERSVASRTVHDAEELELEVERLRVTLNNFKMSHQKTVTQLEAALQESNIEREEKLLALKSCQSLRESCAMATERQHAAEEKLAAALEETRQTKLHADMLVQCYKQQIEDLKTTHNKKITTLTEQLENLQASFNINFNNRETDQASNVRSEPSPIAEWASNAANAVHPDQDFAIRMSSLTREEGEGSESIDSFPSRRISVTSHERRHELVPLDKLLSSSSYPEDESNAGAELASSTQLNIETLQTKLIACEARVSHLTALLSEAESDSARLSQLNAVLKEEIRRQQRSEERTQHAHNLEYLKNVIVKFVTLPCGDERQRLVPVIDTILKLSPDEAGMIASVAKGVPQASTGSRGWGSYLPIPGWSGS